jgi:hypothetical protein
VQDQPAGTLDVFINSAAGNKKALLQEQQCAIRVQRHAAGTPDVFINLDAGNKKHTVRTTTVRDMGAASRCWHTRRDSNARPSA